MINRSGKSNITTNIVLGIILIVAFGTIVYLLTSIITMQTSYADLSPNESQIDCRTQIGKGLRGFYCFEGNYKDSSGNKNDAQGETSFATLVTGNNVAKFDGETGFVRIMSSESLKLTQMSESFWISVESDSDDQQIIRKGSGVIDEYLTIEAIKYGSQWRLTATSSSTEGKRCTNELGYLKLGWHMITITRDPTGNLLWYIDGEKVGSDLSECKEVLSKPVSADNPIYIGTGGSINMKASFDNLMIYDRPLAPLEIKQIYIEQLNGFRA